MGSLGFLAQFELDLKTLERVIPNMMCDDCEVQVDERMRLVVNIPTKPEQLVFRGTGKDWMLPENGKLIEVKDYHILNEVVIDRGPMTQSVQLDIYIDG